MGRCSRTPSGARRPPWVWIKVARPRRCGGRAWGVAEVEVEQVSVAVLSVDAGTGAGRQPGQPQRIEPCSQVAFRPGVRSPADRGQDTDIPVAARTMTQGCGGRWALFTVIQ